MAIGWEGYLANGGPQGPIYAQNRQRTASNRLLESHRKQSSNGLQHRSFELMSNPLTRPLSSKLRHSISQPFQSLTSLQCWAESRGIIPLFPYLSRPQSLGITLADASTDILSNIASKCPHLQSVSVEYGPDSRCDGSELISVAERCKALHTFEVTGLWVNEAADGHLRIRDSDIERFTKGLPKLKICRLYVESDLTEASLRNFGCNCRLLEEVMIRGSINLQGLTNDIEPLFPKLIILEVLRLLNYGEHSVSPVADMLRFHAPRLELFDSGTNQHEIDREVLARRLAI